MTDYPYQVGATIPTECKNNLKLICQSEDISLSRFIRNVVKKYFKEENRLIDVSLVERMHSLYTKELTTFNFYIPHKESDVYEIFDNLRNRFGGNTNHTLTYLIMFGLKGYPIGAKKKEMKNIDSCTLNLSLELQSKLEVIRIVEGKSSVEDIFKNWVKDYNFETVKREIHVDLQLSHGENSYLDMVSKQENLSKSEFLRKLIHDYRFK